MRKRRIRKNRATGALPLFELNLDLEDLMRDLDPGWERWSATAVRRPVTPRRAA